MPTISDVRSTPDAGAAALLAVAATQDLVTSLNQQLTALTTLQSDPNSNETIAHKVAVLLDQTGTSLIDLSVAVGAH